MIASVIEHANKTYVDTKNCSCEKHLFVKLVSPCEGEILNTTETSSDDKKDDKKHPQKSNSLIQTIRSIIISLLFLAVILLVVITIVQEIEWKRICNFILIQNGCMKEIGIKNRTYYFFDDKISIRSIYNIKSRSR